MSSRNAYLSGDERKVAGQMNVILKDAIDRLHKGDAIGDVEAAAVAALTRAGFDTVDYVAVRDAETSREDRRPVAPGAHPRRRQDRQDAAHRQHGGLKQTQLRQFGFQLIWQALGALQVARVGRGVLALQIAPALKRAMGAAQQRHQFGLVDDGAMEARPRAQRGCRSMSFWRTAIWPLITQ